MGKVRQFRLVNDTVIEAFAASEEAITGDTRYKCILMDEAAKWKLVDDTPVFNSVEPVVRAAGGDLFLVFSICAISGSNGSSGKGSWWRPVLGINS